MKKTIQYLQAKKKIEKITAITAYDALFSSLFDSKVDIILVGDSLNMSFGGKEDTLSMGIDEIIYHTKAVCRGAKESFIIADMPFGSYQNSKMAIKNAVSIYKKTSADAIKIEGDIHKAGIISDMVSEGIAVIGHIGLMPQFARSQGGYKIKGKTSQEAKELIDCAIALEKAGACMIVLEGIYTSVATQITENLKIPTIGIGSGINCDGQILVWSDMFGFFEKFKPKFVRKYLEGSTLIQTALQQYVEDVKNGNFPSVQESYQG
ncbi:3-methyl-2-oxobutanoate hydroxymethyltransferase [Helicobacter cappadocius]|uniref:3-methyl-2-oxobutanoate hydroxymethyltransferase n=1 Tax=Helicobacter cappadocius TaxID=3063998 RepID=A0AA90PVZ4_9HELI|nr:MULTISPECIES: 3-methyl-2-oxobutanoate hydroxymethyltransferase [unclassified Helicobacter]MDO7253295.1 3-methyl-2-oxobutanoate hydroxymethyltransferase [Helicobacter sp. faydin-H75]MDP2539275.1 3-methyl-2-oxobutanoate hydroxymethyltransferase [Helicobacter sp. faydin-H76]